MLRDDIRSSFRDRGFTRRDLGRIMSLLTAGAALPFFGEPAMAQLSSLGHALPADAVKINANENPMGPCAAALGALTKVASNGGRYQYEETYDLAEQIASMEGLDRDSVLPYPGSSLALHHCVLSFTSPTKRLVTVDPGYEAAARAAEFVGAKVTRVPLAADTSHDIDGMLKAGSDAGLFYICNPNNPTGSVTAPDRIDYLVKNKPAGSVLLLDEAYIHFTDEPHRADLVKSGEDVVLIRTFSKIYGMAGLRAGYALGRPDLLAKMRPFSAGALPVTGMAAAKASLQDDQVVPERKAIVTALRKDVTMFLKKHGFDVAPSVSCKFMVDTKRPVRDVIKAMADEHVYIGRPWDAWPTSARISIGTADEMERFKNAFLKMASVVPEVSHS